MMVSTNEGAVSPSQLGTRHLFLEKLSYWLLVIVDLVDSWLRLIINYHEEGARFIDCCSPLFCVPCIRRVTSKGGGKPILATRCRRFTKENWKRHMQPTLETNTNSMYVGISTISKPYWTVFYRIKWALKDMSELGDLFLTKSSLHIIAWDLDVRDHSCRSWMMSNPGTQ